jgi:hypothetical protein
MTGFGNRRAPELMAIAAPRAALASEVRRSRPLPRRDLPHNGPTELRPDQRGQHLDVG